MLSCWALMKLSMYNTDTQDDLEITLLLGKKVPHG